MREREYPVLAFDLSQVKPFTPLESLHRLEAILKKIKEFQILTEDHTEEIKQLMETAKANPHSSNEAREICKLFYEALHRCTEELAEVIDDEPGEKLDTVKNLGLLTIMFGTMCKPLFNRQD